MAAVGIKEVCSLLNLSESRVGQLAKEGLPKMGRGRYDASAVTLWYIRYLQQLLKSRPATNTGETSVAIERAKCLKLDAELKELELEREKGSLVTIDDVAALWEDAVLRSRSRMLSAVERYVDDAIKTRRRSAARTVLVAYAHEFLTEVVTLGHEIEREEGDVEVASVLDTRGKTSNRKKAKSRRKVSPRKPKS